MKIRHHHFTIHTTEAARDLGLALVWITAALFAGAAVNIFAIWYGVGQ